MHKKNRPKEETPNQKPPSPPLQKQIFGSKIFLSYENDKEEANYIAEMTESQKTFNLHFILILSIIFTFHIIFLSIKGEILDDYTFLCEFLFLLIVMLGYAISKNQSLNLFVFFNVFNVLLTIGLTI